MEEMQRAGCGERTLWARLSPSIVLNTDWTATLFAMSGWASKREFVGSCSWEMQGHILLQHSWILGLRMPSGCVSFWMATLLSHVSFILRQALFTWVPDSHQQLITKSSLSKSFPQKFQNLVLFVLRCVSYPVLDQILWPWLSRPGSLTHLWVRGQGNRNSEGGFGWSIDKEQWLHGTGAAKRRYPTFKVRSESCEGIYHVQSQEWHCALLEQPWRATLCPT